MPQRPCVPTLALDQSSVWLAWNKPDNYSAVVDFNIYSKGKKLGCASANAAKHSPAAAYIRNFYAKDVNHFHARMTFHAFLVTGLQPNSSHTFTVRSVDARGHESADSVPVTVTTAPEYGNVRQMTNSWKRFA
jgi:exo-poly-alpha-galacturonosidase